MQLETARHLVNVVETTARQLGVFFLFRGEVVGV